MLLWLPVVIGFTTQDSFVQSLQRKLRAYYDANLPSKLHFFFNQPAYAPGDTAYFKASFLTEGTHAFIGGHQIIHIELADQSGRLVSHQQVLLDDGVGANQLAIPVDLAPGRYTFTAYSEWMKNRDRSLFYFKDLLIAGPKKISSLQRDTLAFFPEGGALIAGVMNKVIATGKPQMPVTVADRQGNAVASFVLDASGMAAFYLTPSAGQNYAVKGTVSATLPEPKTEGVAMLVTMPQQPANPIRVVLQVPDRSSFRDRLFYLILSRHYNAYYSAVVKFDSNPTLVVNIPRDNLPSGIMQLTLFDEEGSATAERLLYSSGPSASIATDIGAAAFNVREQVVVKIKVADAAGNPVGAKLAATVFADDLFDVKSGLNRHPLLLHSDLSFRGLDAGVDFERDETTLDKFLITRRWKGFSWQDVWKESKQNPHSFQQNLRFTGRVNTIDGKELPDSTKVMFFLPRDIMTYEVYTDRGGKFDFPLLLHFWNQETVYCRVEHRGRLLRDVNVVLDPYPGQAFRFPSFHVTGEDDVYGTFFKRKVAMDAAYSFRSSASQAMIKSEASPHALLEEEIFGVDTEIKFSDYLLFPTMEETLREIIPYVIHRKQKDKSIVRIYFDDVKAMAQDDPVYFIDGVITDNTTYFMSLKPEDISVMKIIRSSAKLRTFGALGKNGIILVETKLMDNARNVPPARISFETAGLNREKKFITRRPVPARVPDFRSTLYWNPEITTDERGEATITFYTADNPGRFRIQLDGITAGGEPVFVQEIMTVTFGKTGGD